MTIKTQRLHGTFIGVPQLERPLLFPHPDAILADPDKNNLQSAQLLIG